MGGVAGALDAGPDGMHDTGPDNGEPDAHPDVSIADASDAEIPDAAAADVSVGTQDGGSADSGVPTDDGSSTDAGVGTDDGSSADAGVGTDDGSTADSTGANDDASPVDSGGNIEDGGAGSDVATTDSMDEATDASCTGFDPGDSGAALNRAQGGTVLMSSQCTSKATEMPVNVFDNNINTKWYCSGNAKPTIAYQFGAGATYAINAYSITSANDTPTRDPKSWRLEGSNDGGASWITVDIQTDQLFSGRFQTKTYAFGNCAAYARYRFVITANNGATGFQVAEIRLFGDPGPGGPIDLVQGGTTTATSTCNTPSAAETPDHAFDNDISTRWFCGAVADAGPNTTWFVAYDFGTTAHVVNMYSVTSASDASGRDPKDWELQGSSDGINWTTLDARANQTFANRFQTNTYSFANTSPYSQYRFLVTANNGSPDFQVAEIMLFGN